MDPQNLQDFLGRGETVFAIGVVENNVDPLTLGRVKARYFGFHPEDRDDVPTKDLPWSQVITQSANISGVGSSPNYLQNGSWVFAIMLDGKKAQYPLIMGAFPHVSRPNSPQNSGNSGAGFHSNDAISSGNKTPGPYHEQGQENPQKYPVRPENNTPGKGATSGDNNQYLTKQNISNWPLKIYKWTPARGDQGLACKDGNQSLRIHRASAEALESMGRYNINSGYRTREYNEALRRKGGGAATNSLHIEGRAFDVSKNGMGGIAAFITKAAKAGFVGFGVYPTFVHIDTGRGRFFRGATAEYIQAAKAGGWYEGKRGLDGVKTNPGEPQPADNAGSSRDPNDSSTDDPKAADNAGSSREDSGNFKYSSNSAVAANQQLIVDKFRAAGYTDTQISGVLAAVSNESGFDPLNVGDAGKAHGLFQWNDRFGSLQNYANSVGGDWKDPNIQTDFAIKELGTTEKRAGNLLKSAQTPSEAAAAMGKFERYNNYQNWVRDDGLANKIANGGDMGGFISSKNGNKASQQAAGFRDPTNSHPYGQYRGKPSTNEAARGHNASPFNPQGSTDNSGKSGGFPLPANKGTFATEPVSASAPQYPYNTTYASISGHLVEYDDTPGAERVNVSHRKGSKIEMNPGGSMIIRTTGNAYKYDGNNSYHGVNGDYNLGVVGDVNIRSTTDMALHADGSITRISYNDVHETSSGKYDIMVGETLQIKAKRIVIQAENIDFYSTGDIKFQAEKAIHMKSKEDTRLTAKNFDFTGKGGIVQVKTNTDFKIHTAGKFEVRSDKEMKLHSEKTIDVFSKKKQKYTSAEENINIYSEGEPNKATPPFVSGAEKAGKIDPAATPKESDDAKSTDLGEPLKRKTIKKENSSIRQNPDTSTVEETYNTYGV